MKNNKRKCQKHAVLTQITEDELLLLLLFNKNIMCSMSLRLTSGTL